MMSSNNGANVATEMIGTNFTLSVFAATQTGGNAFALNGLLNNSARPPRT